MAKVTLSMAKKFAADAFNRSMQQHRLFDDTESPLPFDNLDENIVVADALFTDWPEADAIIGNPPYQSQNKKLEEFGPVYLKQLRDAYPGVPGYADYCVYWFRKAHDALRNGGRAGLVGTNTIRQNQSRVGGLDYIVQNGGTIIEAVGTMPWSGEAQVHVSIVNWMKGASPSGPYLLAIQKGDDKEGPWDEFRLPSIPSSLSPTADVTGAVDLNANSAGLSCHRGQTNGQRGFLLTSSDREKLIAIEPAAADVIFPFMIAEDMIGRIDSLPSRYAIDMQSRVTIDEAMAFPRTFALLKERVLPTLQENAAREERHYLGLEKQVYSHRRRLERWWLFERRREELIAHLGTIPRYVVCGEVTKRPIFAFVSREIRPNNTLIVFPFADDYSFGILQSSYHWAWFTARCSTLKGDYRYTPTSVYYSFPWPQWGAVTADDEEASARSPRSPVAVALAVAEAARELRRVRAEIRAAHPMSLRELYRTLQLPGANRLRDAHAALDKAVGEAYAWGLPPALRDLEPLSLLLELNKRCAAAEAEGRVIVGPGLPPFCEGDARFLSDDCLRMPAEPDGTPVAGGKFTGEGEIVGHTDLTDEDILDLEERRERAAAIDREIYGDDF